MKQSITCDNRDRTWINSLIGRLIQDQNQAFKRFKRSNNNSLYFENFESREILFSFIQKILKKS